MGGIPSVVKKDNKVDPAIDFFAEQENRAKKGSPTLVSVARKNGQLVWTSFNHKSKPNWDVFDVGFKGRTGAQRNQPSRMPQDFQKNTKTGLGLNKENILEKQRQAEKNRLKHLETKKKTAASFAKVRIRENENNLKDSKTGKVNQLAKKHAKAAENRKKQLENIKATAKKGGNSVGRRRAESQIHARAQHVHLQIETKMNITQENRKKIVENVIRKQQRREKHAKEVRDKVGLLSLLSLISQLHWYTVLDQHLIRMIRLKAHVYTRNYK